jgi:hypothetical protein
VRVSGRALFLSLFLTYSFSLLVSHLLLFSPCFSLTPFLSLFLTYSFSLLVSHLLTLSLSVSLCLSRVGQLYAVVFFTRLMFKVVYEEDYLYSLIEVIATLLTLYLIFLIRVQYVSTYQVSLPPPSPPPSLPPPPPPPSLSRALSPPLAADEENGGDDCKARKEGGSS